MSFTTISVIGLGYIGLPTAAAFASRQKKVIGIDVNKLAVEPLIAAKSISSSPIWIRWSKWQWKMVTSRR